MKYYLIFSPFQRKRRRSSHTDRRRKFVLLLSFDHGATTPTATTHKRNTNHGIRRKCWRYGCQQTMLGRAIVSIATTATISIGTNETPITHATITVATVVQGNYCDTHKKETQEIQETTLSNRRMRSYCQVSRILSASRDQTQQTQNMQGGGLYKTGPR